MAGVIQLAIVGLAYLRSWMNERETRVSTRIETPGPTIARAAAAREAAADLIEPTGHPSITLVTCYPFHWIGPAPRRFVVRGHAVGRDDGGRTRLPLLIGLIDLPA